MDIKNFSFKQTLRKELTPTVSHPNFKYKIQPKYVEGVSSLRKLKHEKKE